MTQPAVLATLPVLRSLLDQARQKNYRCGVLGVRARPEWPGPPAFTHAEVPVRIRPCVSALAVREALLERADGEWLVVLTDRPEEDLGSGILSHLLWHRLRTPDPWEAVRSRFAASGVDPVLTAAAGDREIAAGLLAACPATGWPPAAGGVLTRDHALGAVAAEHLGLTDPLIDATSILTWTAAPAVVTRIADLRALAGNPIADVVLDWAADVAGSAGGPLRHLLRAGLGRDTLPLGLVAGLLEDAAGSPAGSKTGRGGAGAGGHAAAAERARLPREALIRLEPRLGGTLPAGSVLRAWGGESTAVLAGMLRDPASRGSAEVLLAAADEILHGAHGEVLAGESDLLPSGLNRRFAELASALRDGLAGTAGAAGGNPDAAQLPAAALAAVEAAWARVARHQLADADGRTRAFHATARLARWLAAGSAAGGSSLRELVERHRDSDAWVDSAVADAAPGVSDPDLGAGLVAVLDRVRARRTTHDLAFAAALVGHTRDEPELRDGSHAGVWHLEDLLLEAILPLARRVPVLLLVLDGMSAGVATEMLASVTSRAADGWAEALAPGRARRGVALAVLPTVTEVSRASLLSGRLTAGGQDAELRGYQELTKAHGLRGAKLFHKKPLDSARPGHAVNDDVARAIADVTGRPLVTCVLNAIDDALDRSDPGGTKWTVDAVRHMLPLLECARRAGRVVVLTADHGHVVERRQGVQRQYTGATSARSRAATGLAGEGEVLVGGSRVIQNGSRAVLAVDERLRYGPLKAGYHGGASPAEVVVPVAFLVSGAVPDDAGLSLAPPQEPPWWADPLAPAVPAASRAAVRPARPSPAAEFRQRPADEPLTLFDEPEAAPEPGLPGAPEIIAPAAAGAGQVPDTLAAAVTRSRGYLAQKKVAGRVSVTDEQVRGLLTALLAAAGQRLAPTPAATALAISPVLLRGAVLHVQRLLNVEGYPVLRVDSDGATLVIDEALLLEQFGISS